MNKLKKQALKTNSGFTLVELAVVLAIVSVLAVGSATLFSEQKVNADQEISGNQLKAVKIALLTFAEQNHYLPCPDTNVEGENGFGTGNRSMNQTANFAFVPAVQGRQAQAATDSAPSIPAKLPTPEQPARSVNVDVCAEDNGTVPFEMIGLSRADVTDAKNNLFRYAVNQGVTVASNIADCPVDSACFFNRNSAPAFNHLTEPVAGRLGANKLRVCQDPGCAGPNLLSDGLIAIVLALNDNATNSASKLSTEEQENRDNDDTFIEAQYDGGEGSDYFDDLLVTISGTELKREEERTFQMDSVPLEEGDKKFIGADLKDVGAGSSGTNVGTDKAEWDRVNQGFDFGVEAANQEIVLTYKTRAVGDWDQPPNAHSSVTSDTATVSSNGTQIEEYKYDYTDNTQDGVQAVSFTAGFTGNLNTRDQYGNATTIYITEGETVHTYADYWLEEREIIVQADSAGQVDLEFAAGTTATYETIDFTDIELVYYRTPAPIPSFPKVDPIVGITQTEGLL